MIEHTITACGVYLPSVINSSSDLECLSDLDSDLSGS